MKREIRKMYMWAIAKVLLALLGGFILLVLLSTEEELSLAVKIFILVLWSIAFLVYLISGIGTIFNGAKQAKEYIHNSSYSLQQLDEEYEMAIAFGRTHVGEKHVFANASDQFYILPLRDIEDVWVRNHGANSLRGRQGYYYLYIQVQGIEKEIKVYYVSRHNSYAARDCINYQKENERI